MRRTVLGSVLLLALVAGCGSSEADPEPRTIPSEPPAGMESLGGRTGVNPFVLETDADLQGLQVLVECTGSFVEMRVESADDTAVGTAGCGGGFASLGDDTDRTGGATITVTEYGEELREERPDDENSSDRFAVPDDEDFAVEVYARTG